MSEGVALCWIFWNYHSVSLNSHEVVQQRHSVKHLLSQTIFDYSNWPQVQQRLSFVRAETMLVWHLLFTNGKSHFVLVHISHIVYCLSRGGCEGEKLYNISNPRWTKHVRVWLLEFSKQRIWFWYCSWFSCFFKIPQDLCQYWSYQDISCMQCICYWHLLAS